MSQGSPPPFPPPGAPLPEDQAHPVASGTFPPPGGGTAPGAGASYRSHAANGRGGALPPGMLGAAHKPGAFPLRPLTLGSIYDGAFRIIRFNPKATVGAAVMVTAVAMLVPALVTTVLTFTVGLAIDATGEVDPEAGTAQLLGLLGAYGSLLVALLFAQIGITFVTGMVAHVTRAAAVGKRLTLGQAWAATHGKRWRLLGLTLLVNLAFLALIVGYVLAWVLVVALAGDSWVVVLGWGALSAPAFICLCWWLWIRVFYVPVPALMLEDVGILGALGRAWTLSDRQFWRTLGIALLTLVVGGAVGSILSTPISLIGVVGSVALPEYAALFIVLAQAVGLVAQNAFVAPFTSAVVSVQYVDLRMRKEAFDVELMRETGIAAE